MSEVQKRTLDALRASVQNATALPAASYLDPRFFDLELERVLRPGWHAVGRFDELPEPGDYRAFDLLGERILLVRGHDGILRALSGTCRHRAFPVADGEGNTRDFQCPYHRWTYDLEGRLRGAPFMDDVAGFDAEACRLPVLPLEIWQGFVMVSTNLDAAPLGPQLTALDALLAPVELDRAVHAGVTEWESPWNWKVMVENFMESYHHLGPHADSLGRSHPARGTHDVPIDGPCAVLENPSASDAGPFWVIQVFPTLLLAPSRGEFAVCPWYEMRIDRHDHLQLRIHLLVPPAFAGNADIEKTGNAFLRAVHLEDIEVCEGIQRGLRSALWKPGPLSPQEATMRRFHRFLADALSESDSPG